MQRIKRIVLKNFKFFYGEVTIELERLNTLIYGENGSGKSSVYWALYTFLQSVFKSKAEDVQKYFNPRHEHNLINRFADETQVPNGDELSYIKLVFGDEHLSESAEFISGGPVGAKNAQIVKQAAAGSELINYRILSRIHDFKNSEQIDLFPVMDKDILMFVLFRQNLLKHDGSAGSNNAQDWWDYIKPGMQPRGKMHEQPYQDFQNAVFQFNIELSFYLDSIIESVNDYLEKFKQEYTVAFDFEPCVYDPFEPGSTTKRIHKTFPPRIYLKASAKHTKLSEDKKQISRLHTFFNEAKLTAIALSIRFAMLDYKLGTSNLDDDTPKILVLDDLLLSLDMSNRDLVLDIILGEDFSKYQLLIFTHDRNFFELIRHKIKSHNPDEWKYIEMYECEKDGIPQPYIKSSGTYLEKAEKYFHFKEYEAAGNFLRKEAEAFCKEFLPKRLHYTSEYNIHDLNGLIQQCLQFAGESGLDKTLFNQLDGQRKFVLNPTSHDSYNVPKFNSEISNCLETLKNLRKIAFESFLSRGTILFFELTETGTGDKYQFKITLEDDFRLIKEPGKDSALSKGMINYRVIKNGQKGEIQHKRESIKKMYETNYAKSDKTKSPDFWEEVRIDSSGESLKVKRVF